MSAPAPADLEALALAAIEARRRAYAPYSGYAVGAAIRVGSGAVFSGCNVENASYGLTLCAERVAAVHMIAAGERDPVAIAIATRGPVAASPCGMCRQTLAEFAPDLPVLLVTDEGGRPGSRRLTSLAALLPDAFDPESLRR